MNSLNNKPSTKHRHNITYLQEWGQWERKDGYLVREKRRYSFCGDCGYRKNLRSEEIETVGGNDLQMHPINFLNASEIKIANHILKELYKSNNKKRWNSWKDSLFKKWNFGLVEITIDKLHMHGFIIKRKRKDKTRINHWNLHCILFNEDFMVSIESFLKINKVKKQKWEEVPFPPLSPAGLGNTKILFDLIQTNQKHYNNNGGALIECINGEKLVFPKSSGNAYLKIVRGLHGLYQLTLSERHLFLREFSQEFFGDTKLFSRSDRDKVDRIVGDVEKFGLLQSRNEVLISGNFEWAWNGEIGNSRAIKNYLALPRDMVSEIKLTQWQGKKLLIIENQDLFISVAKGNVLNKNEWIILFGSGYLSAEEYTIIRELIPLGLQQIYFWCDLDPYGFLIADNFIKNTNTNIPIYLFGFNSNWFSKLPVYKELLQTDKSEIDKLLKEDIPFQIKAVLFMMKETGFKGEQEYFINFLDRKTFEKTILAESIKLN